MVIYYKVLKKVENPIFAPKMVVKPPSLGLDPSQTWSWTQTSFVASKIPISMLLNTPIAIYKSSKQWIFHIWKCPKFVDSVFHQNLGSCWNWMQKQFDGPWWIKEEPHPIFFASFWRYFGPPFSPPNYNLFTHSQMTGLDPSIFM